MIKFSANLGLLFTEFPLDRAIEQAHRAGFHAVEFHFPFDKLPASEVKRLCDFYKIPALSLNSPRGGEGDFGLLACAGREKEAGEAIDQAIDYAKASGIEKIHLMAGKAKGYDSEKTYVANLEKAVQKLEKKGLYGMIEPLNSFDNPDYFLKSLDQAEKIVETISHPHLGLIFDIYHLQRTKGFIEYHFKRVKGSVFHIQFAAIHDRGEPDRGEIDYGYLLPALVSAGYQGYFGAEYRPRNGTEAGISWLKSLG